MLLSEYFFKKGDRAVKYRQDAGRNSEGSAGSGWGNSYVACSECKNTFNFLLYSFAYGTLQSIP